MEVEPAGWHQGGARLYSVQRRLRQSGIIIEVAAVWEPAVMAECECRARNSLQHGCDSNEGCEADL